MPINSKPLTSARENRSNYNEWKSIWDSYKNSKDYQTLADYSETLGPKYDPINRINDYINYDIPIMMKADSLMVDRLKKIIKDENRFKKITKDENSLDGDHPVMKVPKITDSTKKMIDEFIAIPTNDKKALIKFFGDEFIDKERGTTKSVSIPKVIKNVAKNPTLFKYLPFAKRLSNTFSTFGEQAPPLYKERYSNGWDPVSRWTKFIEKNE